MRDTAKSDCTVQIFRKMMKYIEIKYRLLVYLTSYTVFSGDIKKKPLKMKKKNSENEEKKRNKALKMTSLLVIFRAFLFIFFVPPTLNLKKISHKTTNKKHSGLSKVVEQYKLPLVYFNQHELFSPQ